MGEKSDLAKRKILDEFFKLICIHGYNKTSLSKLSSACKMSKGHINFYFKKKEDLIISITNSYFINAYEIINNLNEIPNDNFLKFLLFELLIGYMLYKNISVRLASEMSENNVFIFWRAKNLYNHTYPEFKKIISNLDEDSLMDASIGAVHAIYGRINYYYTNNKPIDYKKNFCIFIKILFTQLEISDIEFHTERALQIFETLDKKSIASQLPFYKISET